MHKEIPLEDEFADIVRKAQRGSGASVKALAAAAGCDAETVAGWLRAEVPSPDVIRAIAPVLRLDAESLCAIASGSWHAPDVDTAGVRHHPQNPHPSNGYVFFLEGGKRAALVDPAGTPQNLLRILREGEYHLQYILITHKHADHCDATAAIAQAFPDAQIVMHELDVAAIGTLGQHALRVRDGEALPFGDNVSVRMLHTPGHTDGSSSYIFKSNVFTGDTLFAGSIGGAYGDVSTYGDILNSVRSKLFTLPDATVAMPGHGPPTTIGFEKEHNPFFPKDQPA
ncbi:MAG: MBL fold metallo-hydrolase [Candidatus Eremiobacteraeota bacterium]|nr:MBL fold metallo-hydrolase [Candidatus Eremiobacteraeota bacterium]